MITQTLLVRDSADDFFPLQVAIVDQDSELWDIEEPTEPVISVTFDGDSWIVYGDDESGHPEFHERWWPGERWSWRAKDYARRWARAVHGVWEEV